MLRTAEEDIKRQGVRINTLTQRIDKAIAEVRSAASGQGGAGPAPGPT
jgi:hypothetical protein